MATLTALTIRLGDKLERELKQLARTQRKTKSEVACKLMRRLDDLRDRLRPYAEAAGAVTDEGFFWTIS